MFLALIVIIFDFNETVSKNAAQSRSQIAGAIIQFIKSFILVNLLFVFFNTVMLGYLQELDTDGNAVKIVTLIQVPIVFYFAIAKSRAYVKMLAEAKKSQAPA